MSHRAGYNRLNVPACRLDRVTGSDDWDGWDGSNVVVGRQAAMQVGGALAVAAQAGGAAGPQLAHLARTAFISGMDLGLLTVALVALAGALLALTWLPRRSGQGQI
jgi:hypothetical protein